MDKNCIHIKKDYEFRRVYKHGTSLVSPCLVTYCDKRKSGIIRIGITTGKKIGNAVRRSRARRVIREAFRQLAPYSFGGWDIVFVARGRTPYVKMQDVRQDMLEHLTQLGVIKYQLVQQENNSISTPISDSESAAENSAEISETGASADEIIDK